jgi:pyruvate dehydrogenase E2 component (dihydrolipoamide acetyltransferase)
VAVVERISMPQLGETVTEGTITKWWKQVGDAVAVDDVLFEVSTDKVDTEVPSAHAGILREILVPEGETVPIGTPLAVITAADEPVDEPAGAPPATEAPAPPSPQPEPAVTPPAATPRRPTPPPSRRDNGRQPFLSPVVRALLVEHGIDPHEVEGSGHDGRITRADVLAVAANRRAGALSPPAAAAPVRSAAPSAPAVAGPDDDVVEFTKARRATAEHMVRSLATSAHTLVVTEVDYHGVDTVRARAGLSYLAFVARAAVDALGDFPHLNASVGDDELIVHRRIHLGVAVDVEFQALVVPVIRDAATKRLRAIATEVADLAARARAKRLGADDLSGGTFTITTVGRYGTVVTAPVINQPQVAILSADGVRMRPVAVATGEGEWTVAVRPIGNLSLSFDHRAVDGAYASAFLARTREILEGRDWSQEV